MTVQPIDVSRMTAGQVKRVEDATGIWMRDWQASQDLAVLVHIAAAVTGQSAAVFRDMPIRDLVAMFKTRSDA